MCSLYYVGIKAFLFVNSGKCIQKLIKWLLWPKAMTTLIADQHIQSTDNSQNDLNQFIAYALIMHVMQL